MIGPDTVGGFGVGAPDDVDVLLGAGAVGPPVGPATANPAPNVYIALGTANVVPVEFVTAPGVGITRARLVGAPGIGIVPVREAPTDANRVRICLAP